MEKTLDTLCDLLEDELERQQNVLALCVAQGQAARTHDLEYLEAKTAALGALIQEAVKAERERLHLVRQVVEDFQLPRAQQTLSDLIAAVPDPWKTRLCEFQGGIRAILAETSQVVRENNRIMRRSLHVVDEALNLMVDCVPAASAAYDARGAEPVRSHREPHVINQQG